VLFSIFSTNFVAARFSNENRSCTEPLVSTSRANRRGSFDCGAIAAPFSEFIVITDLDVGHLQIVDHAPMAANGEKHSHIVNTLTDGVDPTRTARKTWGRIQSCAVGILRVRVRLCPGAAVFALPAIGFIPQCVQLRLQSITMGKSVAAEKQSRLFQAANCQRSQLGPLLPCCGQ